MSDEKIHRSHYSTNNVEVNNMANDLDTKKPVSAIAQVKHILATENVKARFSEIMGEKAPQFMASIINVVNSNKQLQECSPNSIMGAAMVAATYDLPIDNNLGFSAIVPYGKEAQFQMMYKGFVQLAIRSKMYKTINYSIVYNDELKSYNPITGELVFVDDFEDCTDRHSDDDSKIAGYYAKFELNSGFVHELFMTKKDVDNHARRYSSAYRYDLNKGKKISPWSTNFNNMALKTVLKLLLSKWGILSIDIQNAIRDDQKTFDEDGHESYGDNKDVIEEAEVVDVFAQNDTGKESAVTTNDSSDKKSKTSVTDLGKDDSDSREAPVGPPSIFDTDQININDL